MIQRNDIQGMASKFKPVIQQILTDYQHAPLPKITARRMVRLAIPSHLNKGLVFAGVRRCGKTYALFERIATMVNAGIDRSKALYLNFEDDRLLGFAPDDVHHM